MFDNCCLQVLKKFGVEKFDPTNEPFDPHRHNAIFQIPDASKEPGTVGVVLKVFYILVCCSTYDFFSQWLNVNICFVLQNCMLHLENFSNTKFAILEL